MKHSSLPRALATAAALALSTAQPTAFAQASAPAPQRAASASASASAAAASAPAAGPRLLTPEQKRSRADQTAAPDLVPERAVIPQVSIPLGTKSAPARPVVTGSKKYPAAKVGGDIDDGAARCLAEASDAARAACMDKASGKLRSP